VGFCELADCRVAALFAAYTSATDDSKLPGTRKAPLLTSTTSLNRVLR
jgi:hypothetical protein